MKETAKKGAESCRKDECESGQLPSMPLANCQAPLLSSFSLERLASPYLFCFSSFVRTREKDGQVLSLSGYKKRALNEGQRRRSAWVPLGLGWTFSAACKSEILARSLRRRLLSWSTSSIFSFLCVISGGVWPRFHTHRRGFLSLRPLSLSLSLSASRSLLCFYLRVARKEMEDSSGGGAGKESFLVLMHLLSSLDPDLDPLPSFLSLSSSSSSSSFHFQ